MRRETKKQVLNLLVAVAGTLELYGRPRKHPGCWRVEAETGWGHSVRATHPNAVKWSLLGAIKADARTLGYSYHVRKNAMLALLDVDGNPSHWGFGSLNEAIVSLDDAHYDNRHIVRLVKKAAKAVERKPVSYSRA